MYTHVPPAEIEFRSLAIIDAEVPEPRPFSGEEWSVARRMIHTTADFDLLRHIRFHPDAVRAGKEALLAGADIVTDTCMALAGIPRRRLDPLGCAARCLMNDPVVAERAARDGVTRAWAAVDEVMDQGGADLVDTDMVLGPEMKSTGEVLGIDPDLDKATQIGRASCRERV